MNHLRHPPIHLNIVFQSLVPTIAIGNVFASDFLIAEQYPIFRHATINFVCGRFAVVEEGVHLAVQS